MLVIVCASSAEAQAVKKRIQIKEQTFYQDTLFMRGTLQGRALTFVQTGVGPRRAKSAAQYIIQHANPSFIVLVGAAGAVDPRLKVGDIVIINKILRKTGPIHDTKSTGIFSICFCDAGLNRIASELIKKSGLSPLEGDCLTTERFVHLKEKKQWIHTVFNVKVVEMESAALASVFSAAKIPFVNLRVVSDTNRTTIVDYEKLIAKKIKSGLPGVVAYFLRNPGEMLRMFHFRRNMLIVRSVMLTLVEILVNGLPDGRSGT